MGPGQVTYLTHKWSVFFRTCPGGQQKKGFSAFVSDLAGVRLSYNIGPSSLDFWKSCIHRVKD